MRGAIRTIVPRARSLFISPQPPHNTKEASGEERDETAGKNYSEFRNGGLSSNFNSAVEASVLELDRLGMSRVIRNEKVKAISTLASGQDLLARLHSFSCQNASCSKPSFFFFFSGE